VKHGTLQIVGRAVTLIWALALGWGRVAVASDQADQKANAAEADPAPQDGSRQLRHGPRRHAPPPSRDVHDGEPWLARTSHDVKD
jgi:hypothetical protein